jgi:hypothetical protein
MTKKKLKKKKVKPPLAEEPELSLKEFSPS